MLNDCSWDRSGGQLTNSECVSGNFNQVESNELRVFGVPLESKMEGYAKVAGLMARYDELAILRGFKNLNLQNLLYLQAEIIHLEDGLKKLADTDAAHSDRKFHSKDWWSLAHGDGQAGKAQWRQIRKIRRRLAKYSETTLHPSPSFPHPLSDIQ